MISDINQHDFDIAEMTSEAAEEIASWKYPKPYEIYNFSDNDYEVEELMNGLHFSVYCPKIGGRFTENPCGFAAIGWSAQIQDCKLRRIYDDESYTDIAFGLHPELCGKGMGKSFVKAVIEFVKSLFDDEKIRLTVDTENKRAHKLYESIGFKSVHSFRTFSVPAANGKMLSMEIMVI